jgi:hypothetical protein
MEALPTKPTNRLGFSKDAYAAYKPLELGDWKTMGYKKGEQVRWVSLFDLSLSPY